MTSDREPPVVVPLEYANPRPLYRQWWLVLLVVLLAIIAAFIAFRFIGTTITVEHVVEIERLPGGPSPALPSPSKDQADIERLPAAGLEVTVVQRDERWLPGGEFLLTLGDITGGQVLVSLSDADDKVVAGPKSMRKGDVIRVDSKAGAVELTLEELRNHLTGDDFGIFRCAPSPPEVQTDEREAHG